LHIIGQDVKTRIHVGGGSLVSLTTFLSNDTLWQKLSHCIKTSRHVDAAIAYFGQGGPKLLPLRRGDRLIVDMSPATVRAGGNDPREVEKLIRRGIRVFTRRHLHAKTIVTDRTAISGSANVSKRSQQLLDEAAILTNAPSTVRRAREFIERLSTEPVLPEYLEQCKQLYRPPRLNDGLADGNKMQRRTKHAKLWVVNLREYAIPDSEAERYHQGEVKVEESVKNTNSSDTDSFHWPSRPRMADELELGEWIIRIMTNKDMTITVYPPGRLLFIDTYVRDLESGKKRYAFHLEVPKHGETMCWEDFRRAAKSILKTDKFTAPRTRPIRDVQEADRLFALWTPGGKPSRR
jgi:hypothetical protein